MNKQFKSQDSRGIEWTDYTWNPISGCFHGCAWTMPDGSTANCYAEDVADRVAQTAYPDGFEHHYWKPTKLLEPIHQKKSGRIFVGSMADVFGHWVPAWQIEQVLITARDAYWHTFQFLTKNPKRLKQFHFPLNCWAGISSPPDFMWGKALTWQQRETWLQASIHALAACDAKVKWMSIEPLSGPSIAHVLRNSGIKLDWVVIGAASDGNKYHQPDPEWVDDLVKLLRSRQTAIFYKGNLQGNPAADPWREEFPA